MPDEAKINAGMRLLGAAPLDTTIIFSAILRSSLILCLSFDSISHSQPSTFMPLLQPRQVPFQGWA